MHDSARIILEGREYQLPVIKGTEGEKAVDISKLRAESGFITFDDGYGNTGSCVSKITFIDGEKGVLRYRGYPIEQLAESSSFLESAWLIIYGELPTSSQLDQFSSRVLSNASVDVSMDRIFEGFPKHSHPMAMLAAILNSLGCYYPNLATNDRDLDLRSLDEAAAVLISKVRTVSAMAHRMKQRLPFIWPRADLGYCQNFLHMMFSEPYKLYFPHDDVSKALDLILLLHADHEQNCSTSTVRMVASGGANLFASISAGVSALWGPLHGGANQRVVQMLEEIHQGGDDGTRFIEAAKRGETRLMGFGHRVYKNFDPRAKILRTAAENVIKALKMNDPLLDIARRLQDKALQDPYFVDRKLYPNVDFYSGIILRAIGIPVDMFTVMFAIGRMPGWIANWKEVGENSKRIHRPRQVYFGQTIRDYIPVEGRS